MVVMSGILIKDVPRGVHEELKRRAAENRRSLSREVLVILEAALDGRGGPMALSEIDRLRVRGRRPLEEDLVERALERTRD